MVAFGQLVVQEFLDVLHRLDAVAMGHTIVHQDEFVGRTLVLEPLLHPVVGLISILGCVRLHPVLAQNTLKCYRVV